MRYWNNPDEDAERAAWYAKQNHLPYPDDLPFRRRMRYGPHTPEVAQRYLDADYPLPGTFPAPKPKNEGNAAWYDFLKEGVIYPGSKLNPQEAAERQELVKEFAASGYLDAETASYLHGSDRETGYSPIFEFQYHVINFSKYGSVVFFRLNGVMHTLHWDGHYTKPTDPTGWKIDQKVISDYWDEAEDNFYLFRYIGYCMFDKKYKYPVIDLIHIQHGDPEKILSNIPPGPVSDATFYKFRGPSRMRRNPDVPDEGLIDELKQLEEEYFSQPRWIRQDDIKRINELRKKIGLQPVDDNLRPVEPPKPMLAETPPAVVTTAIPSDPHQEARELYNIYLQKEAELKKHRTYCQKIIRATAPHRGQTPIEPLATMGTGGGPLLCDYCGEQIPLEGGPHHGTGAGIAWERGARGYSYILGGVSFVEVQNGTLRVYHDYGKRCGEAADRREELARKDAKKGSWNYATQEKVRAFLQEMFPDEDTQTLLNKIRLSLYGYDPGVGINHP